MVKHSEITVCLISLHPPLAYWELAELENEFFFQKEFFFASSNSKSVNIYRVTRIFEILMITLISSKKLGGCNNMRQTASYFFYLHIP